MRVFLEHRQRTKRFFANPVKVFITANSAHRAATENFVVSFYSLWSVMMWRSFRCESFLPTAPSKCNRGQEISFSAKTMIDLIKVIEPEIQSRFLARLEVRQDFAISEMLQISTVHDYSALKDYFLAYSKTKAAKIYLFLANSDSTAAQCETELCRAKSRSQSREKSQACCEEAN